MRYTPPPDESGPDDAPDDNPAWREAPPSAAPPGPAFADDVWDAHLLATPPDDAPPRLPPSMSPPGPALSTHTDPSENWGPAPDLKESALRRIWQRLAGHGRP